MVEFKQKGKYIYGMDALRTLAITLITLFHIFPEIFVGGYIGVCLFLVITGFLLAYGSTNDYMSENFSVIKYYLKRLKRLYPPLLIVILITVGVYHFLLPGVLEDSGKEIISILLGFNNWWQLAMNADYFARVVNASPFTHMWFLGVEIEYVAFWPLLFLMCMLLERFSLMIFFAVISACVMMFMGLQGEDISRLYYGTDARIFACLLGGVMGFWFAEQKINFSDGTFLSVRHDVLLGVLLIPVLIATFFLRGQYLFLYAGGMQILTLIFCMMLFVMLDDQKLGNYLEFPVIKWIGGHSYEIFLWQYPVLFFFQRKTWHDSIFGPVLEILVILILSAWSKEMLNFISKFKLPFDGADFKNNFFRYAFASLAIFSAVIMCFGMKDVLASDFNPKHQPGYKLKMELEQKQAELEKAQAERAAKEAEQAAKEAERKTAQEKFAAMLRGAGVTMIGDSVMVGASPAILELMPEAYVDALSSRDVCGGFETAQKLQQEGKLSNIVVIALGTNGPLLENEPYASGMQNLLNVLGTERQIFWITVYCSYSEWMAMNNKYLTELEQSRPNFHLIDWYPLAKSNPDWLHSDGTHPSMEGIFHYAKLIQDTLAQKLSAQYQ